MIEVSGFRESVITEAAQQILKLAQNFDKLYPELENLKKSHFSAIT